MIWIIEMKTKRGKLWHPQCPWWLYQVEAERRAEVLRRECPNMQVRAVEYVRLSDVSRRSP